MPEPENGRVSVLQEQYRQLRADNAEIKALLHEACGKWERHWQSEHDRLLSVEARVALVEHRIGVWQTGQALFTTVASTIAGWLGTRS